MAAIIYGFKFVCGKSYQHPCDGRMRCFPCFSTKANRPATRGSQRSLSLNSRTQGQENPHPETSRQYTHKDRRNGSNSDHSNGDDKHSDTSGASSTDDVEIEDFGELKAGTSFTRNLPELRSSTNHVVFFKVPPDGVYNRMLEPCSAESEERWNKPYVCMSCSKTSKFCDSTNDCSLSRWEVIKRALEENIQKVSFLKAAICAYNPESMEKWSFAVLKEYFRTMGTREKIIFFYCVLPTLQDLALQLPELCTRPIPILKKGKNMKLTFSQRHVACLLANAFFCTFPKQKNNSLPDFNFGDLYQGSTEPFKIEQMKCIINYFKRITMDMPAGTVSYARQCLDSHERVDWSKQEHGFCQLLVSMGGRIDDESKGMLQTVFSKKDVDGGVLGNGKGQEAIRFVLCPEMILSRLFTEELEDNEVLIMTGCERFSDYKSCVNTFKFNGNYTDNTPRDAWGRKFTEVVVIDVLDTPTCSTQFDERQLTRELTKAYCAFKGSELKKDLPVVRTGNWGSGTSPLRENGHLKALIQLMAASVAGRDVCYCTYDQEFGQDLAAVHTILKEKGAKVKDAFVLIQKYYAMVPNEDSLFHFIINRLNTHEDRTDGSASAKVNYEYANFNCPTKTPTPQVVSLQSCRW